MISWTSDIVTTLAPNEVFVFGSNEKGFHGAGAAGLAMRGDPRSNWRDDPAFLHLVYNHDKPGCDLRGKWAIYGVGRGFQQGRDGTSYAVATVTRPWARRSVSRRDIYHQLAQLWKEAWAYPDLTFLITPLGEGYAGYSPAEMNEVWEFLVLKHGLPPNVRFVGRRGSQTNPYRASGMTHGDMT